MTDFSLLLQPDKGQAARPIILTSEAALPDWLAAQPQLVRDVAAAHRFTAKPDAFLLVPGVCPHAAAETQSGDFWVLAGVANPEKLGAWSLARAGGKLPEGNYRLIGANPASALHGWLMAQYAFDRYKIIDRAGPSTLLLSDAVAAIDGALWQAEATALTRDLVNTPAADMGPDRLEAVAADMASRFGAQLSVMRGDELEQQCPMIHAVGRAAMRRHAPRLIELRWGHAEHPKIAIVGKGVCFDSGGLNIKNAAGMLIMKKDMGGAAHALALAQLIMQANLPVRLHCLIPAVENAIDGNAMRPGDILRSRAGITVEITNTDAEGRLVLGDALTIAAEDSPELILDFATLTGAARVALGPDLPAMFARGEGLNGELVRAGVAVDDPVWPMPLWEGYRGMLGSHVADCVNSAAGGFAGAITAALFLDKFVPPEMAWAHFDTYAWRASSRPGRPKGGDALGLRASWAYLQQRYGRS